MAEPQRTRPPSSETARPTATPAAENSAPGKPPPEIRVGSTGHGPLAISVASRSTLANRLEWFAFAAIALSAISADQLTKRLVANTWALGEEVHILGPFSLTHIRNSGIAFGFFSGWTSLVAALTGVVVIGLLTFFARSGSLHPLLPVVLGLIVGGTVSNLLDRVRLGYVTDYLDLQYWPAFNLADTFIVSGIALLLIRESFATRQP